MPKKPPPPHQPSLFGDSLEPPNPVSSPHEGDNHAIQDHSPRTLEGPEGPARTAAADAQAPADPGNLLARTEGQPRDVEGDANQGESRQRSDPDFFGSDGVGPGGTGGSFTQRLTSGRPGTAFARPGNGLRPNTYSEKVRASSRPGLFDTPVQPSFDSLPP